MEAVEHARKLVIPLRGADQCSVRVADTDVSLQGICVAHDWLPVKQCLDECRLDSINAPQKREQEVFTWAEATGMKNYCALVEHAHEAKLAVLSLADGEFRTRALACGQHAGSHALTYFNALTARLNTVGSATIAAAHEAMSSQVVNDLNALIIVDDLDSIDTDQFIEFVDSPDVGLMHTAIKDVRTMEEATTAMFLAAEAIQRKAPTMEVATAGIAAQKLQLEGLWKQPFVDELGLHIGNWTCLQSCFRDLDAGETRKKVCDKVAKGICKRKHYAASESIMNYTRKHAGLPPLGQVDAHR